MTEDRRPKKRDPLPDRILMAEWPMNALVWPLTLARGRGVIVRLIAMAVYFPWCICALVVLVPLVLIPCLIGSMWCDVRDGR